MELSERFEQVLDDLEYAETEEQKQARKAILTAAYAAALARIASLEAERRWIPVSERLPEPYERILVSNSSMSGEGMYADSRKKFYWNTGGEVYGGPIFWMPLPPAHE